MSSPLLPEEIIGDILSRLPVRFLFQLKCVCKSWKTLISDPQFAKCHLRISTADPSITNQQLVFCFTAYPYRIVNYPLKQLFENTSTPINPVTSSCTMKYRYQITGSCNGLLCLFDCYRRRVRLCNPSIMFKSKKSPEAFSRYCKIKQYGFGYDQVNDKYKVLVTVQSKHDFSQILTKIYTFGENSWKIIQDFPLTYVWPTIRLGKFVNGTINWIVKKRGVVNSNQSVILSFDVEKETYGEVLLPQNDGNGMCTRRMPGVLRNCLCVCDTISISSEKVYYVVWMMKDYGVVESWTKLTIIPPEKIIHISSLVEPLFISENEDVLLLVITLLSSRQLVLYNLNSGELDHPLITTILGRNLYIYRHSLVSPRW